MPNQSELNQSNEPLKSSVGIEDAIEKPANPFKAMLLAVGGLAIVLSIFALLPMFFTYLSEGDIRAPSELHPTDTAAKLSGQNESYESKSTVTGSNKADYNEKYQSTPKKFSNNLPMN